MDMPSASREKRYRRGACRQSQSAARRRDSRHFVSDTGTGRGSSVEPRSGCTVERSVGRPPRSWRGDVGGRPLGGGEGRPGSCGSRRGGTTTGGRRRHHAFACFALFSFFFFFIVFPSALFVYVSNRLPLYGGGAALERPLATDWITTSDSPFSLLCGARSFHLHPLLHEFSRRTYFRRARHTAFFLSATRANERSGWRLPHAALWRAFCFYTYLPSPTPYPSSRLGGTDPCAEDVPLAFLTRQAGGSRFFLAALLFLRPYFVTIRAWL